MKIDITVDTKDNLEVKEIYGKVDILVGDVVISFEKKDAIYLLECLENTLIEEDKQRSTLENTIERLEEKIEDLENEFDQNINDNGGMSV